MFSELKIQDFIEKLSSDSATPGGGTASALAGSMSASLLSMVMRISTRKITDDALLTKMRNFIEDCDRRAKEFLVLMDKDADAFDKVMEAYKLPKFTKEQKEERRAKIQIALKSAALTPLKTMEVVRDTVFVAKEIVGLVPGSVISDIGVSSLLARSALNGAYYNVKINLKYIKDKEFNEETYKKAISVKKETEYSLSFIDKQLEKITEGTNE